MTELLSGIVVALLTASGVWATARAKRQGDKEDADLGWVDRLTARVTALEKKTEDLSAELEEVKLDRFRLRVLVQAFTEHVLAWRRRYPDAADQPEAPDEVEKHLRELAL